MFDEFVVEFIVFEVHVFSTSSTSFGLHHRSIFRFMGKAASHRRRKSGGNEEIRRTRRRHRPNDRTIEDFN